MTISLFDLFSIGVGPSSSHTVGPMRACGRFLTALADKHLLEKVARVQIDTYGSLALTGKGHGTEQALLMGLEGERPDQIDTRHIAERVARILEDQTLHLAGNYPIAFQINRDLLIHIEKVLSYHANGMTLQANDAQGLCLFHETYYSIGGGFVVTEAELLNPPSAESDPVPHPFASAAELFALCDAKRLTIAEVVWQNERTWRSDDEIDQGLEDILEVMMNAIERGLTTEGTLPGGLNLPRRAMALYQQLAAPSEPSKFGDQASQLDWLNVYAMAVNEENAAGHRVVTAPTNGAAGVLPAILAYYREFHAHFDQRIEKDFLLTASAIALLYKQGASLSAAEVGCQGEIGVASSMAAGALTAALGGSLEQIGNAAEIAMEHHLGMTCDPIKGLVQIPCIERNAMGAVKAVNACHLALSGTGQHYVPLDSVIATMKRTGHDMMTIYKETSLGGLAVNVPAC